MTPTHTRPARDNRPARALRVAAVLAGAVVAAGAALALPVSAGAQSTAGSAPPADPNDYTCTGHIQPGVAEPGNPDPQVQYYATCNGPITGYSILTTPSSQQITNFDAGPTVELASGPVLTDSFECDGALPGNGFNCVGNYAGDFATPEIITGQFSLTQSVCKTPTFDPQLLVDYATVSGGVVSQAISGPFDLGKPQFCPATSKTKAKAKTSTKGRATKASTASRAQASRQWAAEGAEA